MLSPTRPNLIPISGMNPIVPSASITESGKTAGRFTVSVLTVVANLRKSKMEMTNGQMIILLSINAVIAIIAIITAIKYMKEGDDQ